MGLIPGLTSVPTSSRPGGRAPSPASSTPCSEVVCAGKDGDTVDETSN